MDTQYKINQLQHKQKELTEKINQLEAHLKELDKGLDMNSDSDIIKLCKALQITPNELLGFGN